MFSRSGLCSMQFLFKRRVSVQNVHQTRWIGKVVLESLESRSILGVRGSDAVPFLQGLITNDMNHLLRGSTSMYAMFLNTSGRVLYDSLIYRVDEKVGQHFLVECDTSVVEQLAKHLNLFRVRKKVEITKTDMKMWVAFTAQNSTHDQSPNIALKKADINGTLIFKDARLPELGYRLLTNSSTVLNDLKTHFSDEIDSPQNGSFVQHRYSLGIGEGVINLPPGKCFPLENNCDYLHGVSFHKGCYIGQELTARTYHTGVIRKRLMPLIFDQPVDCGLLPEDAEIKTMEGQTVGKLRGYHKTFGLGLLRIEKVISSQLMIAGNTYHCKTFKPDWWLKEQPIKN
ncbi:putative transferase CAF17, mitochondrial [Aedes aegypti]|uniref:Uncharacterized protein n=1 Tax=Aedes aegypti TaxID=7159 RepID=A0A6I8TCC9_AEDAE|nr:putative transferase CAF17, mitochondrial [Aedes aegypti]